MRSVLRLACALVALSMASNLGAAEPPLTIVVMDPLAAPLSCPCVKGYAQRDYQKLAEYLEEKLGRKFVVKFGESLEKALADADGARADLIIGKRSVVLADGKRAGRSLRLLADLTGKDGSTTQRGLIVVRGDDGAKSVADLKDYRLILGPTDCEEKNGAARELFLKHGFDAPADGPISAACSDGAAEVVETGSKVKVATVISSYAQPLLEGCGTIKKGDLRVLAETRDVPFVSAFVDAAVDDKLQGKLREGLLQVGTQPLLRLALESKAGFRPIDEPAPQKGAAAVPENDEWPGFRGPRRDAVGARLPARLPAAVGIVRKKVLLNEGLGGPAVAHGTAVVGDRDADDTSDVFHAVDAATGARKWSLRYPAAGRLDYGNSPRATPLIHGEFVYTLGAFGHLHCLRLANGKIVWKKHLREEFGARDELVWGACSSPLIVDDKLIVNPGGTSASLVALDPNSGKVLWKSAGAPPGFASFIVTEVAGRRQIVGYDKISCGGWNPATGEREWSSVPKTPGDFNVPTPLIVGGRILLAGENNGLRLIDFENGRPREAAFYRHCAPDMHTPVLAGDRIFAAHKNKLHCLSAENLQPLWTAADRTFAGHTSLIAGGDRVLLLTQAGELLLIDTRADQLSIVSRLKLFDDEVSLYAHPAVVGDQIFVRGPSSLLCIRLTDA